MIEIIKLKNSIQKKKNILKLINKTFYEFLLNINNNKWE